MSARRGSALRSTALGALAATLAAALVAGCGLPTDETVQRYDVGELSPVLSNTTTTTTTTFPATGTPTTSGAPTTPSTTTARATAPVTVYYTLGLSNDLQPSTVERATPIPIEVVINLLESPVDIASLRLRTSVRTGLIESTSMDRGTLTVELDRGQLDRMSESEERRAIAQMVLSFTSFVTNDAGAIGAVRFEVDGEGYPVYVPAGGGNSEAGESLAFDDFKPLIVVGATGSSDSLPDTTAAPDTATEVATTTTATVPITGPLDGAAPPSSTATP